MTSSYLQKLEVTAPLRRPVLLSIIDTLSFPPGSAGIDVGCGIGHQAFMLADAVGPLGHVTGIDVSAEFLARARELASQQGYSERLTFQQGSADHLPFDDGCFDWAWSSDCVGYGTINTPSLIAEMARVVRPGGTVAVVAWASERLLPGYPMLEARLGTTVPGMAPFSADTDPPLHLSRGLGWLKEAGFRDPVARAFAGSVQAPLSRPIREAMIALFEMRWPGAESELSPEDQAHYRRLCDSESPEFLLDHPDYYGFFTYSLFKGTKSM